MKETTNKRTVILGSKMNRESLYYTLLFFLGTVAAAVLIYVGKVKMNKGLTIYSIVLCPIFLICALIFLRFTCVSRNAIYRKGVKLVVKHFLPTRRLNVAEIDKITVAQNGADGITSVNITYHGKTFNYKFKNVTKEEAAHIRRASL